MKKLSIIKKAKAYDEALERARKINNGEGVVAPPDWTTCEVIFPELKESEGNEDERIRKALMNGFNKLDKSALWYNGITNGQILSWLEKQGEQRSADIDNKFIRMRETKPKDISEFLDRLTTVEQEFLWEHIAKIRELDKEEQKPTDKVEPKFKDGDWITDGKLTYKVLSVVSKSYELHLYNDDYCHFGTDVESVDEYYHLWTIKDAKAGDVLHSTGFHSDCVFIFNGLDNWKFDEPNGDRAVATGYCGIFVSADNIEFGIQGPDCVEVNTIKPATKKQRDLLFQKMKEAGYEWDAENKQLRKIEQKPADKVEPKFHEGDIVKPKDGGHEPWQIMQVDMFDKKYIFKDDHVIHFSQEDDYELVGCEWNAEKKELKKIVDEEQIKKNLQDNSFRRMFEQKPVDKYKEWYDFIRWFVKQRTDDYTLIPSDDDIHKWGDNILNHARKVLEQNTAEWNEEDERMYRGLHNLIYSTPYCNSRKELSDWLKSLKDQYNWKPSDEQMDVLLSEVTAWTKGCHKQIVLESLYNDLKKLREE